MHVIYSNMFRSTPSPFSAMIINIIVILQFRRCYSNLQYTILHNRNNLFDFVYNNLNCRSKSLSSFWSELNVKPKYLISSVYFSNWLSIYNLGYDNLNTISEWLLSNKLSLNIKKTKYMVFHTNQKRVLYPNLLSKCDENRKSHTI